MTWGSKATADHQASAQVDVKSQENWARWAEKLQTQQMIPPRPTGDTLPATQRGGLLGGPGGGPASLPLSWGPETRLCRRGHGGNVTPPPRLRLQSSGAESSTITSLQSLGAESSAITSPYRLFLVVQSKPLVGKRENIL